MTMPEYQYDFLKRTWLGNVYIACGPAGVVASYMGGSEAEFRAHVERIVGCTPVHHPPAVSSAIEQVQQYLQGKRKRFALSLDLSPCSPFQQQVLLETSKIPFGCVASYGEIARRIDHPAAARAVGQALRRNPIPLIIPCHRVIGSDSSLTGFGGSKDATGKAMLLRFEGFFVV
jgi:methylated-DNA-[protein]-cysteine S-methyltransferase